MKSLTWSNISIIRLGQECLWRLCVILPVISGRWTVISYFSMLPGGGENAKIILHCTFSTWRIRASTRSMSLAVPKVTGRNEKSVCGVQSIHKHTTHPLKSDSVFKKSNFVKQHKMRGGAGTLGLLWWGEHGAARHPRPTPKNTVFYYRSLFHSHWCKTPLAQPQTGMSVVQWGLSRIHQGQKSHSLLYSKSCM